MRLVLIDPDEGGRRVLAQRLSAQGYTVEAFGDPAAGANAALAAPPAAVVADLWMRGISGVQVCRLLQTEPATGEVPVILRATDDTPRDRFWARHAGATGYVAKGRMGELVRTLERLVAEPAEDDFFFQLAGGATDVRDRIAAHLDEALFESVVASEVRALSVLASFERLVDRFSQLMVQVIPYRWMALRTAEPARLGLHCRPADREAALAAAQAALGCGAGESEVLVEDDDAEPFRAEGPPPLVAAVGFGGGVVGQLALAPLARGKDPRRLVDLAARELGGPLRIVALVEETRRLASIDGLTGLPRRNRFTELLRRDLEAAGTPQLALGLLDLDHFKRINDTLGHGAGDRVLSATGRLLAAFAERHGGYAARWGGEEFVFAVPGVPAAEAYTLGEQLCTEVRRMVVADDDGHAIPVTASLGMAQALSGDTPERLTDRADRAMYVAKSTGRNRVCGEADLPAACGPRLVAVGQGGDR